VMAATVHDLDEVRLREAGIVVPAVRKALRTGGATPPSFHLTDYRMTAEGADRLAKAIADAISGVEALSAVPRAQFQTQPAADAVVTESVMRAALQRHCAQELPPALVQATVTQRLAGAAASGEAAIFGGTGVSARIAVVGTEHIGDPGLNLTGALSQATGLDAIIYTVDGGGAFGAISSYMTSRAFQEQRPAVLVWVNPVENNLATFGDQPLAELTVAAGDTCRIALPVLTGSDAQGVTADLSGLSAGQGFVLFVDAEGTPATEARFDFRGQDGLSRSFWVVRNPDQVPTGRFYLPMSGVGDAVVTAVDVRFDVPVSGVVRMAACNG
jgi:alginate biosynthesis protein AlgX